MRINLILSAAGRQARIGVRSLDIVYESEENHYDYYTTIH